MWWKLAGLVVVMAVLIYAVIPIRTQVGVYDPLNEPPPANPSLGDWLAAPMYLTPSTVLVILLILAVASFVAFKVLRRRW